MSINQDITNLPTPPNRSDSPSDFSDKADAFLAALPTFQTELNTYADEANTTQTAINTSETNAADAAQTALEWASKIDGIVDTTEFSAKAYALGGTGVTDVTGSAKEWAIKTGSTVDGAEFSAKKYASDAEASASAAASTAGAVGWSAGTTYSTNDAAIGSDGNTYRSLIDNNTGNDPVTGDDTKWRNLTGTAPVTKAELTKTFVSGESATITLTEEITGAPVVSVTKEVPQIGVTNNDWDVAADGSNFTLHDTAYDTTLTPSNATGNGTFTLGTGSFAAEDAGKRIVGNGGEAILTAADGSYELQTAFNDTSTIASGDWSMFALDVESADLGLTLSTNGAVFPTNTAHTAITSTSINTEFWADINSMTADDTLNDGAVYYAVSTDDRTTWSVIDDTNGVRNIVRNNGGTWEVNDASDYGTETWVSATTNNEFSALEEATLLNAETVTQYAADVSQSTYSNKSLDVASSSPQPSGIFMRPDGSRIYSGGFGGTTIEQYDLSTPFDISSGSQSGSFSHGLSTFEGVSFKPDGTRMYANRGQGDDFIRQYDLSTPWDITTAVYNNEFVSVADGGTNSNGPNFNSDGTKMYVPYFGTENIAQYSLSVPYDITTASYDNVSYSLGASVYSVSISPDDKILIVRVGSTFNQFSFSTPGDLSTLTDTGLSYPANNQDAQPSSSFVDFDQGIMLLTGIATASLYQYDTQVSSITTLLAGVNGMPSDQLNAVSDANQYTLGNDLDLAITLFMVDGGLNLPTSDGVSINYDANVKNEGAVLGTDYEFDKPANDTVRVTALSDENFKVRVV